MGVSEWGCGVKEEQEPPYAGLEKEEMRNAINEAMTSYALEPREIQVLELYYLEGKTDEKIGKRVRLSTGRINQIRKTALKKMRHPTRINIIIDYAEKKPSFCL